jgi:hypothetical protein
MLFHNKVMNKEKHSSNFEFTWFRDNLFVYTWNYLYSTMEIWCAKLGMIRDNLFEYTWNYLYSTMELWCAKLGMILCVEGLRFKFGGDNFAISSYSLTIKFPQMPTHVKCFKTFGKFWQWINNRTNYEKGYPIFSTTIH